jgi:glutathione S-transferase
VTRLTLYDNELDADAYPVRLLLSLLGRAHETVIVDRFPGDERPHVPDLLDGAARVSGTEAVLRHLATRYAPDWLPGDQASAVALLAAVTSADFAPRQARLLALFTADGPSSNLVSAAAHAVRDLDDQLTLAEFDGHPWLAGRHPTIVDVAAFPAAALSNDYGVEHDAFPALRRWIRRFRALPGFIAMPGVPQFY